MFKIIWRDCLSKSELLLIWLMSSYPIKIDFFKSMSSNCSFRSRIMHLSRERALFHTSWVMSHILSHKISTTLCFYSRSKTLASSKYWSYFKTLLRQNYTLSCCLLHNNSKYLLHSTTKLASKFFILFFKNINTFFKASFILFQIMYESFA